MKYLKNIVVSIPFLSFCLILNFLPQDSINAQNSNIRKESKTRDAQESYQSIVNSKWLEEKKDIGKLLGGFGKTSHIYTAKLLEDKNYWNRLSGIEAARVESSPEIRIKIFSLYESDHMTRSSTQDLITSNFEDYEDEFLKKYRATTIEKKRLELSLLIPPRIPEKTFHHLESDLDSNNIIAQKVAIQSLSKRMNHNPRSIEIDSRIRSFFSNPKLESIALDHILLNGNQQDLPLFLKILENERSIFLDKTKSLRAIKKWGSLAQETEAFENILTQSTIDEKLAFIAIHIFPDTRSDKLQTDLCQLAVQSKSQDLRIESALALIPYNDKNNIKCLEKIAEETLEPSRAPNIVDAAAVVLTFGIAGFHKAKLERNRRNNFSTKQSRIKNHLIHLKKE